MHLLEADERVHSVFLVGMPHFKLMNVSEAYENLNQ